MKYSDWCGPISVLQLCSQRWLLVIFVHLFCTSNVGGEETLRSHVSVLGAMYLLKLIHLYHEYFSGHIVWLLWLWLCGINWMYVFFCNWNCSLHGCLCYRYCAISNLNPEYCLDPSVVIASKQVFELGHCNAAENGWLNALSRGSFLICWDCEDCHWQSCYLMVCQIWLHPLKFIFLLTCIIHELFLSGLFVAIVRYCLMLMLLFLKHSAFMLMPCVLSNYFLS